MLPVEKTRRAAALAICILWLLAAREGASSTFETTRVRHLYDIEHGMLQPSDAAIGKDRRIYVLDGVNHRVKAFDDSGRFLFEFGGKGAARGRLRYPLGIATDEAGNVYVADTGNRRIQVFGPEGAFIKGIDVAPEGGQKPAEPVDLVVDGGRKRLYVVDNENHHVLVYDLESLSLTGVWGSEGQGAENFNHPFLAALTNDTALLVVDVLNTRVQAWLPRGTPERSIGEWGVDLGQLFRPKGVCVDERNRIYVTDSYLGVIQVFNRYGYFDSLVATEAGDVLKLKTPVGIVIDDRQRLYVVEMVLNRVRVYQILNKKEME